MHRQTLGQTTQFAFFTACDIPNRVLQDDVGSFIQRLQVELTRDVVFDVWQLQFKAFMDTKGCLKWLTTLPDEARETEKASDATAKSHIVLAMKDASLIRLSATSGSSAKEDWDALVQNFEGRMRIRKHEIAREERMLTQKRSEPYVDYCDRAVELHGHRRHRHRVHGGQRDFGMGRAIPKEQQGAAYKAGSWQWERRSIDRSVVVHPAMLAAEPRTGPQMALRLQPPAAANSPALATTASSKAT